MSEVLGQRLAKLSGDNETVIRFIDLNDAANVGVGGRKAPLLHFAPKLTPKAGLFLGKDTTTVLLHIQANLARRILPFPPAGTKIAIQEFNALRGGIFGKQLLDDVVFLVDAVQQSCADGVKTMVEGVLRSALKAQWIAIGFAARFQTIGDLAAELIKAVGIIND